MNLFLRSSLLVALVVLAACATGPPPKPQAQIGFEKASPLLVPAGKVALVDNYKPPLVPPNVEQNHEVRPAHIARRWITARTKPIDTAPGTITLAIADASVIEQPLVVKTDWKHMFSRQAEKNLIANITWRLSYDGPSLSWSTGGTATSTHGVLEEASLNEADEDYNEMIQSLAAAFDSRLEQQLGELRDALASVGAPVPRR
jgi:hypothetical protein